MRRRLFPLMMKMWDPEIQIHDTPNFNVVELRQRLDFRDISLDNTELVPLRIRERLSGVIDRALDGTHPRIILNVVWEVHLWQTKCRIFWTLTINTMQICFWRKFNKFCTIMIHPWLMMNWSLSLWWYRTGAMEIGKILILCHMMRFCWRNLNFCVSLRILEMTTCASVSVLCVFRI